MAEPSVQTHLGFSGVEGYVDFGWVSILLVKLSSIGHHFAFWEKGNTTLSSLFLLGTYATYIFLSQDKSCIYALRVCLSAKGAFVIIISSPRFFDVGSWHDTTCQWIKATVAWIQEVFQAALMSLKINSCNRFPIRSFLNHLQRHAMRVASKKGQNMFPIGIN